MHLASLRGLALALAVVSLGAGLPPAEKSKAGDDKKKPAPLTFPPGTVIAVYDKLADALDKMPNAVVLDPAKYREMVEEIARLRKLIDRPKPRTPSKCLLKGKIEGGLVALQAQFEFATEKAGEVVRLGCGLGQATGVTLDGRTPPLSGGGRARAAGGKGRDEEPEGFSVSVEKPGVHNLTLDLLLPLSSRPGGQGFALDLPRAAITQLELELPAGARDIRIGGKALADTLVALKNTQLSGSLGAADRLDVAWKSPQAAAGNAVLAAESVVQVRIDSRQVVTRAHLTLRVRGGQPQRWALLVPRGAEVKVAGEGPKVVKTDVKDYPQTSLRTLHLKEASTDSLTVVVTATQPAPAPGSGKPIPIGPFTAVEAVQQSGSILVSNTVADWRLEYTPHGDLARRAATEEELRQNPFLTAAFRLGPSRGAAGTGTKAMGASSWLDIEVESVRGQIKTRSVHLLHLTQRDEEGGPPRWRVRTTLTVTPRWADVDHVTVKIPDGCEFSDEGSLPLPDRVRSMNYDKTTRLVEFKLARGGAEPSLMPFTVKMEGVYSAAVDPQVPGSAGLRLPRPVGTIEQDGEVTVRVPAHLEVGSGPDGEPPGLESLRRTTHELSWRCPRRCPDRIPVSWRPYHPAVSVASTVDVTLTGGEGRVRQELRYQLPEGTTALPRLVLRVPVAAKSNLRVLQGGKLVRGLGEGEPEAFPVGGGAFHALRFLPADPRQPVAVLEYTFPLVPRPNVPFAVPLIVPNRFSQGETRVRVWSDSGNFPAVVSGGWAEQNIEEVPGRKRLPVLVLRASRPDLPLTLRYSEGGPAWSVLIERALVRVEIDEAGVQSYRASYRLSRLAARHVDFELPAPAPTINFLASLSGKRIDPALLATDRAEQKGKLVRLRLSLEPGAKPAVLDLSYQLTPGRTGSTPIGTTLRAPLCVSPTAGGAGGVPTRWQVTVPPSWVVIAPEAAAQTPRIWTRRGWLFAPRSNLTGLALERWLAGGEPSKGDRSQIDEGGLTPTLVLWRDGPEVRLTHAPQQAWLLSCSLVLLLLGLMLSRLPLASPTGGAPLWAWLLLSSLVVLVVLSVLLWPTLAGQIAYGCQPGAVVLLLMALVQWLLHERYRRQIVFLPSFSRSHSGSSLQKEAARPAHGIDARGEPRGEPSTVDVPSRPGGGNSHKG